MIGRWVADSLDLPSFLMVQIGPHPFPVEWALLGAILFVALLAVIARRGGPVTWRRWRWRRT